MALASLPPELILYLSNFLSDSSLNGLIRAQKSFARLLTPKLYDQYITFQQNYLHKEGGLAELDPYNLPLGWFHCIGRWQSDVILEYFRTRPVLFLTQVDEMGQSLLHIVARSGNTVLAEILIRQKNLDINCKARNGRTPLFEAITNKREAMIKWLIDTGADVMAVDVHGRTVLEETALCASGAMVQIVIDKLKRQQHGRMYIADNKSALDDILPQCTLNNALCLSLYHGDEHSLRILLDYGADPSSADSYGTTVLAKAGIHGYENIIQILLDRGADPLPLDTLGRSAITCAAEGGCSWETVQRIFNAVVDAGGDITSASALHYFAEQGCPPAIKTLLNHNADVLSRNQSGITALHLALFHYSQNPNNYEQVCQLLIEAINTAGRNGRKFDHTLPRIEPLRCGTSLHLAAKCGSENVVRMLLDNGVDIHVLDDDGKSALDIARGDGHEGVVHLLQSQSIDQGCLETYSTVLEK